MNKDESLPALPSRFQASETVEPVPAATLSPCVAQHILLRVQAAAAFIRTRKNCLAGDWPQLAALLSAFCEANDAAPRCSDTGQSCDIVCLVELVEALPYTEHAALLVLKVSTGEMFCPTAHTVLPLALLQAKV